MKIQRILIAGAFAALTSGLAAAADVYLQPAPAATAAVPGERIYVQPMVPNGSPVHGGFVTDSDAGLLNDAIAALNSEKQLPGSTVTVVAKNGELIVNGSAESIADAYRMENRLKRQTGAHVVAFWGTM